MRKVYKLQCDVKKMKQRPKQHLRRLRSGKRILVNKGIRKKVKKKRRRYSGPKMIKIVDKQSGNTNVRIDAYLEASRPGERMSASGKTYWETRKNRSDINPAEKL